MGLSAGRVSPRILVVPRDPPHPDPSPRWEEGVRLKRISPSFLVPSLLVGEGQGGRFLAPPENSVTSPWADLNATAGT
jgi:hypothetical protein